MSKYIKFGVLVAAVIGLIGFFLPLISVTIASFTFDPSGFNYLAGLDYPTGTSPEEVASAKEKLEKIQALVLVVFTPVALLLLVGILGVALGRFGRGFGALTLLFGLAAMAIYALLSAAISDVDASGEIAAGAGLHMVIVTGVLATALGLFALIKPDTGLKKGKRFKATLATKPPKLN